MGCCNMKFEIEETDIEETDTKEKEINEDIDEVDEIREDNEKPASFCDDVKNEIDDWIYSEEGSSALLEADGLTPEEEGFMKGYTKSD